MNRQAINRKSIDGAIDFADVVAGELVLVCGWVITDNQDALIFSWRDRGKPKGKGTAFACRTYDRQDLPDFLEAGARALQKIGFFGVFNGGAADIAALRIEVASDNGVTTALPMPQPDNFADYFETIPQTARFEIAHLLGESHRHVGAAQSDMLLPAMAPWLDSLPICDSSASVGGITIGFDSVLIGDDGQLFVEGWMKATGLAKPPVMRLALVGCDGFHCEVLDQVVLRPDIAAPGAGGLKRPGFFFIGQSKRARGDCPPSLVVELQHGVTRSYLRLSPRRAKLDAWRSALVNRATDDAGISQDARRALLAFFGAPALALEGPARTPAAAKTIRAICVVDFTRDNPCRGLIQTSLARLPERDLKIIIIADEDTLRTLPDIGPAWRDRGSSVVFGDGLADGLTKAGLAADDVVLFISCATLIRNELLDLLAGILDGADLGTSHWLCAPEGLSPEHEAALERLLAPAVIPVPGGPRSRTSVAYLDFFTPLLAPVRDIQTLSEAWTPPLPGMIYREAIRRAARHGRVPLVKTAAISVYRQQDTAGSSFALLYKDKL